MITTGSMIRIFEAMLLLMLVATRANAAQPNIVLIIADDMAYNDIGAETPSLKALAAQGMRFTDFHAAPYCTPSRADIQTGRYHQRMDLNSALLYDSTTGIPASEITLGERLRSNGYATALIGKWHLGKQSQFNPLNNGYDHFFGMLEGQADYITHMDKGGFKDWWRGWTHLTEPEYSTTAITQEAVNFMAGTPQPFLVVVAYQAVHAPWQAADGTISYSQTLAAMDEGIDDVLAKVPPNTYVFFLSDNGGTELGNNAPLRDHKGTVYEGGQRVAAIVKGPGIVPSTKVTTLAAIDLYPTILALTGTPKPAVTLDGRDFSPILFGTGSMPARKLFWTQGSSWAVRDGRWKLDVVGGKTALYNLITDIGELHNVAAAHPSKVKAMKAAFTAWKAATYP